MFCHKKNLALTVIPISLLILGSCKENKNIGIPPISDTAKIRFWKKNHDSLFTQYRNSGDTRFIKLAGPYADSLLQIDKQILTDTNYRKIYMVVLFSRAAGFNVLENFIKSRELFDQYLQLFEEYKLEKSVYLSYAQNTLANIYSRYGDYKKAALLLQQSLEYYLLQSAEEDVASTLFNLSIPFKELGQYENAVQTLQKIFTLDKIGPKRKAKASFELADIHARQQNLEEAKKQLENAKAFAARITTAETIREDIAGIYSSIYNIEAGILAASGKPGEALTIYRRSLDSASIANSGNLRDRETGKTYIAMGQAFEKLNQYDSALWFFNRALYTVTNTDTLDMFSIPARAELYAENTIAEALEARASCILARQNATNAELENAVRCYQSAFLVRRKLMDAFTYDESRLQMLEETRAHSEKAIGACYTLYQRTHEDKWVNQAFLFAEQNKSFVLAESVRRNIATSLYLQNDSAYSVIQSLRIELAMTETELGKQRSSATADSALIRSLVTARDKKEIAMLNAENSLRIKNPSYTEWLQKNDTITAEELSSKLTEAGDFIEYFSGDTSLYVFSNDKNGRLLFYKPEAGVETKTYSFLNYFTDRNRILLDPAGYAAAAYSLYQSILEPFITRDKRPLLIIPDGFISLVPFDALVTSRVNSTDIASLPYLIQQRETYYAFSCRTLLEQEKNKSAGAGKKILAFAPEFKNKERGLAPLLYSSRELEAIRQFYPEGSYFTAADASLSRFFSNCGNASLIHLATHAGSGDSSAFAGIELYDSTLYLNRIYSLPLKARLVVLSGCETGTGLVNKSEGLMSLARGFSYAGTKNVIGSLWQTEDNTSAEIFKEFYGNLRENNYSTALHNAKLSVINNASVATASPYFWSGYIYIGSYDAGQKTGISLNIKMILLITGLIVIAGLLVFLRRGSAGQFAK